MIIAVLLVMAVVVGAAVVSTSVSAAEVSKQKTSAGGITVHYYCESGTPTIYYWNSLPTNMETSYPGPKMTSEGNKWFKYTFSSVTKINMLFITNGVQSEELTREGTKTTAGLQRTPTSKAHGNAPICVRTASIL